MTTRNKVYSAHFDLGIFSVFIGRIFLLLFLWNSCTTLKWKRKPQLKKSYTQHLLKKILFLKAFLKELV